MQLKANMNSDMFLLGLLFEDFAQTRRPASLTAHPNLIYQRNFVSCLRTEEKSEKRLVLSLVNVRALNIKTSPEHCTQWSQNLISAWIIRNNGFCMKGSLVAPAFICSFECHHLPIMWSLSVVVFFIFSAV